MARRTHRHEELFPDEIFLDSANVSGLSTDTYEGRLERSLGSVPTYIMSAVLGLVVLICIGRLVSLQIFDGAVYTQRSQTNTLHTTPLFAERGEVFDRQGEPLSWNERSSTSLPFFERRYTLRPGSAHLLGFLKYPTKDRAGFYIRESFEGVAGVERTLGDTLSGDNGKALVEHDVALSVVSESTISPPQRGSDVTLSIDVTLNEILHTLLLERMRKNRFQGGTAAIIDIENGELIALTNAPEYSPLVLTEGKPEKTISAFVSDPLQPFLERASAGLYAPGSVIKPVIAAAALQEHIITPEKKILSTGSLSLPNPFVPGLFSVFRDWKAHGWVDMREALAHSSDVYFYEIGGGVEAQRGLGIEVIEKYLRAFGFGEALVDPLLGAASGVVPTPEWKARMFAGDPWRIGDTYTTSIGQYGTLATPLQVLRAIAAIANGGMLVEPTILLGDRATTRRVPIDAVNLEIVREGMRLAVTEGTATGLWFPFVSIAAKTGTAEIGISKKQVHSWVTGFFPYEKPRYAFVILLERGPAGNTIGAVSVAKAFFEWLAVYAPQYLE